MVDVVDRDFVKVDPIDPNTNVECYAIACHQDAEYEVEEAGTKGQRIFRYLCHGHLPEDANP